MSRTTRNIKPFLGTYLREPRVKSFLNQESKAIEELKEAEYTVTSSRLKSFKSRVPNTEWDVFYVSGVSETYDSSKQLTNKKL